MSPEKSQEMHGNGQVVQKGNRLITERPCAEREREEEERRRARERESVGREEEVFRL